jgi:glutaredoxin
VTFEYVDVTRDKAGLQRMLTYAHGKRNVPVIVDNEKVILGYGGGS